MQRLPSCCCHSCGALQTACVQSLLDFPSSVPRFATKRAAHLSRCCETMPRVSRSKQQGRNASMGGSFKRKGVQRIFMAKSERVHVRVGRAALLYSTSLEGSRRAIREADGLTFQRWHCRPWWHVYIARNVLPNPNTADRGSTFEHQPVLPPQTTPRQDAASPVVPMTSGDDLKPSQRRRSLQQRAFSRWPVRALRPTTDAQRFGSFLMGASAEHLTPPIR